ncbi:CRISPR-associated helicase Cas3' [Fusobacterium sp. IOR10]|uniref:CRISPR-associated helicase Cas3' n=1 Tax=Fusobacterium sp. IOR10 TaxID=2665157 RepID=UPI0013D363C9|nr:CRISPR-associated helicase Cas3' [Fusobacterium sp. IOR10]
MDLNKYLAKPEKTIREHTDDLHNNFKILESYYSIPKKISELVEQAIEYHDYGKVNKYFQERVKSKTKHFDLEVEIAHNLLSLFFINRDKIENEDFYKIAYAVMNHHQKYDPYKKFSALDDNILENNLDGFFDFCNEIGDREIENIKEERNNLEAQLVKGFLQKCDYSASGGYVIEYPNDFLNKSLKNLGYKWRELQEYAIENRNENIIMIANTGIGKTEAGLLWIGDNKGFFILPLRTAINAMYDRIKENIIKEKIDERLSLLHSDTMSVYMDESVVEEDKVREYYNKGKNLSMPLTISTLDQIFDFVYKYKGFELKLATLSYSKIVIDEIQAYSPDLIAYIVSALEMINKANGKFAIITATLFPFIKDLIEENIGKIQYKSFIKGEDRHHIKAIDRRINSEDIKNFYNNNHGKILVVCNTIKEAQNIYKELVEDNLNVKLLHSKFTKEDRLNKEKEILEFGKTENTNNGIWVSTSLVEASLDIDFDYLFTELNDISGFFQRLGRVNRKGIKKEMLVSPNVFVYLSINNNLFINGERGFIDPDIFSMSKNILLNFSGILSEEKKASIIEENFTSENLKNSKFIERYLQVKKYIDSLYVNEMELPDVKKYFRNIISFKIIPKEVYKENEDEILENEKLLKERYKYNSKISKDENNKERNLFRVRQQRIKNEIDKYTISVGIYDLNSTGIVVNTNFEKIQVIDCNYDGKIGFIRKKKEKSRDQVIF